VNDDDRDTEPFAAVGPQRSSPAASWSGCRAARVVHGWAGRRGWGVSRLGGALLLGVLLMAGCSSVPRQNDVPNEDALQAGRAFLDSYQDPDGRDVRRDQGGDTVSEGQAYAMLIAVGVRDQTRFNRSWTWSRSHLQQPSGLLAYLWKDDRVADASPAADADSQTAWALALAARQWPGHGYAAAGRTLAEAVADHEIAHDSTGRQVLAAGPWALGGHGAPVVVEPGYWAGPVTAALSELTGDGRWKALRDSQPAVLRQLAGTAHLLPPDWTHLGAGALLRRFPHPPEAPRSAARSTVNGPWSGRPWTHGPETSGPPGGSGSAQRPWLRRCAAPWTARRLVPTPPRWPPSPQPQPPRRPATPTPAISSCTLPVRPQPGTRRTTAPRGPPLARYCSPPTATDRPRPRSAHRAQLFTQRLRASKGRTARRAQASLAARVRGPKRCSTAGNASAYTFSRP